MNSSIPVEHKLFMDSMPINSLWQVYLSSIPTAASVLDTIVEPPLMNAAQETTFNILIQYVGNMKKDFL